MAKRKAEKTTTLVYVAVILVIAAIHSIADWPELEKVAIGEDCTLLARLCYVLFHASILHAAINGWCLLSVVFIYDVYFPSLIISYLIAAAYPTHALLFIPACAPTVGSSGICFAMLGMIAIQVQRQLYYHTWMAGIVLFGFIAPVVCDILGVSIAEPNNWLHIWCYLLGLIAGYLIHKS